MAARQYRSTVEAKTLSSGINNSVTSMTLNSVTTLPSSYPYTLVIDPDISSEEIVTVTASGGGNVLTITRGQDGTSAQSHDAAAVVKHMITARDLQEPQNHIDASSSVHGLTTAGPAGASGGSVVGTAAVQTLTNKTIAGATNTFSAIPQSAVTNLVSNLSDKASTASLASHESDTTSIHGITDTSKLVNVASASAGRTIFVQAATPTALAVGDIWFQVTGL